MSACFIPGRHIAWAICNIWYCACHHGPTWGCLARRFLLPYFPWCVHNNWLSALLWVCLFLQGSSSNTLDFRKNIEESDPFLRAPFTIFDVQHFRRRLRSCRRIFWFHAKWLVYPVQSTHAFRSCCRFLIVRPLVWRRWHRLWIIP